MNRGESPTRFKVIYGGSRTINVLYGNFFNSMFLNANVNGSTLRNCAYTNRGDRKGIMNLRVVVSVQSYRKRNLTIRLSKGKGSVRIQVKYYLIRSGRTINRSHAILVYGGVGRIRTNYAYVSVSNVIFYRGLYNATTSFFLFIEGASTALFMERGKGDL